MRRDCQRHHVKRLHLSQWVKKIKKIDEANSINVESKIKGDIYCGIDVKSKDLCKTANPTNKVVLLTWYKVELKVILLDQFLGGSGLSMWVTGLEKTRSLSPLVIRHYNKAQYVEMNASASYLLMLTILFYSLQCTVRHNSDDFKRLLKYNRSTSSDKACADNEHS